MRNIWLAGVIAFVFLGTAQADEIKISNVWVAESSPGQDTASIKLVITSRKDAKIIEVGSGMAEHVEIQNTHLEGNTMKTSKLSALDIPAKTPITLGEGDNQLMLIGLRQALVVGHKLPFALTVQYANGKTTIVRVLASIKPLNNPIAMKPDFAAVAMIQ